jgi:flagellar biosynthetic protein FliP
MMTFVGVLTALGLVLVVMGFAMRALQRLAGAPRSQGRLQMEVVSRIALGPKQGIAVVRMGGRLVAVSLGEGGVHPLYELDPDDLEELPQEALPQPQALVVARQLAAQVQARLKTALRSAAVVLALLLPLGAAPAAAQLASPQLRAPEVARAATPRQVVRAPAPMTDARADQMVSKLTPQMDLRVGSQESGGLRLSGAVGIVVMMGLMTLLPMLVLMMTSFTRIFVVLSFLKQAMGTTTAPPAQLVAGLSLLLTGFVMQPTLSEMNRTALQPWLDGQMEQTEMLKVGVKPFREFMLAQTRDRDIQAFVEMARLEQAPRTADEIPLVVLTSAFVTSELKTAFQIGFALFLPFIVIDIVVSSVLMSMGMMMLPPMMIALPFKLMLFVLVDGWTLVIQSLVASFK